MGRVFAGGLALTALGAPAPALLTPQAYGALHGFVLAAPLVLLAAAAPGRARDDPAWPPRWSRVSMSCCTS